MNEYMSFFVESNIIIVVYYFVYKIFFNKDSNVQFSRIFLISGFLFALIIPFIKINFGNNSELVSSISNFTFNPVIVDKTVETSSSNNLFLNIFIVFSTLFILKFIFQLLRIIVFIKKSTKVDDIFIIDDKYSNFSFFNMIFIRKCDYNSTNFEKIYLHEKIHAMQFHSIDKLFLEILTAFYWINPAFWLLKRDISNIHEYIVDQEITKTKSERSSYIQLLLNQTIGKNLNLTNSFNKSLTLKRLSMMKKQSSKKVHSFKILVVIPILMLLMFSISVTNGCQSSKIKNEVSQKPNEIPIYPGGVQQLSKDIADETKYPKEAQDNDITGTVYIRFTVNKNGFIENPEILRKANPILDEEAIRVINSLDKKWEPATKNGKNISVQMTFPINFSL
ncbi:MAG: M56 family metallopeptidase [Bacteroidota bacterium]|nr:M56 family metallopeptidase [Bacteroidota bacterium]